MLKFIIFKLKSLFISCKFNVSGVIAFYVFPRQLIKSLSGGQPFGEPFGQLAPGVIAFYAFLYRYSPFIQEYTLYAQNCKTTGMYALWSAVSEESFMSTHHIIPCTVAAV